MSRRLALLLSSTLLLAPAPALFATSDHEAAVLRWREERVARLTTPDGWLSLIGLHWLQPGDNTVGHAPDNTIRLDAGRARLGIVHLTAEGRVTFAAAPDADASVDGEPLPATAEPVELNFLTGRPSLVKAGTVSFVVIRRGERVGLRVRDSESPRRRHFAGIDYFPIDPSWRIEARWVPFDPPRQIPITNILGQTSPGRVPGKAVFTREGRTFELIPIAESADENLFFIITDATAGEETYEAARFLYAEPPRDGVVILDFNRALNPPCAFTPFATCPLPPKENRLPIRVTAGEKEYRGAHD